MRAGFCQTSRGYTLMEMMMVLSIITVAAAIAAPRIGQTSCRYRAELAARRIAADLNLARSQALSSGVDQIITFDPASNSYVLQGTRGLDAKPDNYRVRLSDEPYGCTFVSIKFSGAPQVTFDAYGSADSGGQIVLQCSDSRASVSLEASSGKATVP